MVYEETIRVKYHVNMKNPSPEELIKIVKNEHKTETHYTGPNEAYCRFRYHMFQDGYLEGSGYDMPTMVLKAFSLNGVVFAVGSKFLSLSDIKKSLETYRNYHNIT